LWLAAVDGAGLLRDMFVEFSETRVTYDKVDCGVKLTRWICDSAFDRLSEIAAMIQTALARST